jgi:hypothetical protein
MAGAAIMGAVTVIQTINIAVEAATTVVAESIVAARWCEAAAHIVAALYARVAPAAPMLPTAAVAVVDGKNFAASCIRGPASEL